MVGYPLFSCEIKISFGGQAESDSNQTQAENPPAGDPPGGPGNQPELNEGDQGEQPASEQPPDLPNQEQGRNPPDLRNHGQGGNPPAARGQPNIERRDVASDEQQGLISPGTQRPQPGSAISDNSTRTGDSHENNKVGTGNLQQQSIPPHTAPDSTAIANDNALAQNQSKIPVAKPDLKRPLDDAKATPDQKRFKIFPSLFSALPAFGRLKPADEKSSDNEGSASNVNPLPTTNQGNGESSDKDQPKAETTNTCSLNHAGFHNSDPENVFIQPTPEEINMRVRRDGDYVVHNLSISHKEHGSITFMGFRDLRTLTNADLGKLVNFKKGTMSIEGNIEQGLMYFIIRNITRSDIANQMGFTEREIDDDQANAILRTLAMIAHASYSGYFPQEQTWVLLVDTPPSVESKKGGENGGDPEKKTSSTNNANNNDDDTGNPNMDIYS